tara:strand:+ start:817 stop:3372 length:2556 start_codon:yes stop_codon:yes gene_type:complete
MADKRIEQKDLIDPNIFVNIIKQAAELEVILKNNLKTFGEYIKANPFKVAQDVKDYKASVDAINLSSKALKDTQNEQVKATQELNKELKKGNENQAQAKKVADEVNGYLSENILLEQKRISQLAILAKEQKKLNDQLKKGRISARNYDRATAKLSKQTKELKIANSQLGFTIKAQIKDGQAAIGSFDKQAQRLGQLRSAYRKLNKSQRESEDVGGSLLKSIKVLDAQTKKNDASIGNFQRNVGNYNEKAAEAIQSTSLFGVSLKSLATPMGAVTAVATGLFALYAAGTAGSYDLISANNRLKGSLGALGNSFSEAFGADGKGGGIFSSIITDLTTRLFGLGIAMEGVFTDAVLNSLRDLEVLSIKADTYSEEQLDRIEKEKQKRDDQQSSFQERLKASDKIKKIIEQKEDKQLKVIEKQIINTNILLGHDKHNVDLQKQLALLEKERAAEKRKNATYETEQARSATRLLKEQKTALQKVVKAQQDARDKAAKEQQDARDKAAEAAKKAAEEEIKREDRNYLERTRVLEGQLSYEQLLLAQSYEDKFKDAEDDAQLTFFLQKELNAKLQKLEDDADAEEKKKRDKRRKDNNDAFAEDADKAIKATEKAKKIADAKQDASVANANKIASAINDSLNQVSDKRIAKIEEEEEKTVRAIDRQERRAEQGLENNLAFEQKKAAELEKQREDEAKKQEQRAKVLAYFNLFSEFAKAEPNTAAFKAAAQVAIAETVSGLFYEGTEKVEDDIQGKPMFSGRDGYVVRVDGSERIMTGAQNSKLGGISNDDLVELATNGSGQVGYAVGIDTRKLESKLDSVIKAVQSNDKSVHWDSLGNRFETQIKNEVKKVTKHKKRIS